MVITPKTLSGMHLHLGWSIANNLGVTGILTKHAESMAKNWD